MQDIKDRVEEALEEIWVGIFVAPEYRPILAKLIEELTEREAKLVAMLDKLRVVTCRQSPRHFDTEERYESYVQTHFDTKELLKELGY